MSNNRSDSNASRSESLVENQKSLANSDGDTCSESVRNVKSHSFAYDDETLVEPGQSENTTL